MLKDVIKRTKATAIQCSNDLIAFSCYTAVKEMGLNVGKDISVVGFDNMKEVLWLYPALTTINMKRMEVGAIAAKFIVDSLKTKELVFSEVRIKCELIEGSSVKDLTQINEL